MGTVLSTTTLTRQGIDFINVGIENGYVVIRLNWVVIIVAIIALILAEHGIKEIFKNTFGRKITLDGVSFGIGDFKCELTCGNEVQEIAYQLWVELTTRKIAIPLEEDDVIVEVYDSWYAAFSATRDLLKTIPGKCLDDASDLLDVTTKVLNEGLRPHLTKWQAKYRTWYYREAKDSTVAPQIIQKQFPEYDELLSDMKKTNQNIINFANKMHEIAFGK